MGMKLELFFFLLFMMVFAVDRNSPLPELRATIPQIKIMPLLYGFPPAQIVMYLSLHLQPSAKYSLAPAQLNLSSTLYVA